MATTALALAGGLAAAPASAADKLSVGVGGYMQQWFGMSSVDKTMLNADKTKVVADPIEGGVAQQSDSEVHFRGKLEADNGLTFSLKVELEGNSRNTGDPNLSGRKKTDSPIDESQFTVSGAFGQIVLGAEDGASTIMHYGNRDVGVSMLCGDVGKWIAGVSGCPGATGMGIGTAGHAFNGDMNKISYYTPRMSGVQLGMSYTPNFNQEAENLTIKNNDTDAVSLGMNYQGDFGGGNVAISVGHYQASQIRTPAVEAKFHGETHTYAKAYAASKIDEQTFSNFGLQVDFGAFGFDVAYAVNDGGRYKMDGDKTVKDTKADYEVASAGMNYTDGPMAVSLGHTMAENDNGGDANVTMLSMSYSLAPGVSARASLFAAEQSNGDKTSSEGTAFVTGFVIGF